MASSVITRKPTPRSMTTKEKKEEKAESAVPLKGRPEKDAMDYLKTVNRQGLDAKNFAKLLIKEHLSRNIVDDLKDDFKKIRNEKDRQLILNILNEFYISGEVKQFDMKDKSEAFRLFNIKLNRELHKISGLPSLGEVEDVPKVDKEILKHGGDVKTESGETLTYTPPEKNNPSKSIRRKVAMAPNADVGSQILSQSSKPSDPNMPTNEKKPPVGDKSMDETLKPSPTINPSDTAKPDAQIDLSKISNTQEFTQYQGTQPLNKPDTLNNNNDDPLKGDKNTVGAPTNSLVHQKGQSSEKQEFEKQQEANRNIKDDNGNMVRYQDNEIDLIANQDYKKISAMTQEEFKNYMMHRAKVLYENQQKENKNKNKNVKENESESKSNENDFPPPIGAYIKTGHPLDELQERLLRMRPSERKKYIEDYQKEMLKVEQRQPEIKLPRGDLQEGTRHITEIEQAVMNAEKANANLRKAQELEEATADRAQNATIGYRENTGLGTRVSKAGVDIMTKREEEQIKSIEAYANFHWINEGTRNDSKLTKNSSLQKMLDGYNEMRYTDTFTPDIIVPPSKEELYEEHREYFKQMTQNRFIPQYGSDYIQERTPQYNQGNVVYGNRPVIARPFVFDEETGDFDMGDYTYDHCCVVGTTNMGWSRQYPDQSPRIDYENNETVFPNTMYERLGGTKKYF
jgi:hypothetical protein